MAGSTPSSLCGVPGSVFNTLLKHRASNHPHFFPFLWEMGLALLPLVMDTMSAQTCIGAECPHTCWLQPWHLVQPRDSSRVPAGRVPAALWAFFPSLSPAARQPWDLEPIITDATPVYSREAVQSCWTLCQGFSPLFRSVTDSFCPAPEQ